MGGKVTWDVGGVHVSSGYWHIEIEAAKIARGCCLLSRRSRAENHACCLASEPCITALASDCDITVPVRPHSSECELGEVYRATRVGRREGASALSIRLPAAVAADDAMFEVEASRAAAPFICQRAFTLAAIHLL